MLLYSSIFSGYIYSRLVSISHFLDHQQLQLQPFNHKHFREPSTIQHQTQPNNQTTATMSDKQTSTLQSYVDSATGAVQSVIGSLTGNTADQVRYTFSRSGYSTFKSGHETNNTQQNAGEAKKTKGELEHDASQATLKVGNLSASSSGAVTKDDPKRTEGSWNQTIGSAKEAVGGLVGNEVCLPHLTIPNLDTSPLFLYFFGGKRRRGTKANISPRQSLKQAGAQQNAEGKAQEAEGQLTDLGTGIGNRVSGAMGGAVAGLTGDREAQLKAQEQHDIGKTQQRGAEHDIAKQNQ